MSDFNIIDQNSHEFDRAIVLQGLRIAAPSLDILCQNLRFRQIDAVNFLIGRCIENQPLHGGLPDAIHHDPQTTAALHPAANGP